MNRKFNFLILLIIAFLGNCIGSEIREGDKKIQLAQNAKTEYEIVLRENAISAEKTAAEELRKYLKVITGADFGIITENKQKAESRKIYIGAGKYVMETLPKLNWDKMESDRILIKTQGDNLILAGGCPRGALYATYAFLEDIVGCRWWSSNEEFVPKNENLVVLPINIDYTPALSDFRAPYYYDINSNPSFSAKLKAYGFFGGVRACPEWGGGLQVIPSQVHTYFRLLPPEKYFTINPEWYSSDVKGRRFYINGQLCENNSAMREEMVKRCDEIIGKAEKPQFLSITQQDGVGRCLCAKCIAIEASEGSYSGNMVMFANYVAERIGKKYHDAKIVILPYEYTQKTPNNVKCAKNIVIEFCTSNFSMNHRVDSDINKERLEYFLGWKRQNPSNNFWIWDYNAVYHDYLQPFPNYTVASGNIDFFVGNGVKGIMIQGDGQCSVGDFARMRAWIIAHKLWNPALKYEDLENEFCLGYYGQAAPFLKKYLRLMENAAKRDALSITFTDKSMRFLDAETLTLGAKLFAQAMNAVKSDDTFLKRVERDRIPLIYATLKRGLQGEIKMMDALVALGYENSEQAINDLERLFKIWDPYQISDKKPNKWHDLIKILRLSSRPASKPENVAEGDDWHDFQEIHTRLYGTGLIVEDEKASNGVAVKLPGDSNAWLLQYPIGERIVKLGKYDLNAVVRCEVSGSLPDNEPVFAFGYYSPANRLIKKVVLKKEISDNKYHTYHLSMKELSASKASLNNTYFWLASEGKANNIKPVTVDRIFLTVSETK